LDPNNINTVIAQTAGASSAQTQAAIPIPSMTATFTSNPPNTFTPEPTWTPQPTFVFPTVTPSLKAWYFRVRHDNQLAEYDYKSRTAAKDWIGINRFTPETVPLFVAPKDATGTNRTMLNSNWESYLNSLNGNKENKLRYVKDTKAGLFNSSGFPNLESLTMGGNLVTLAEIQGNWGRVNTFDYSNPGKLKDVDYSTRPDLVHQFVIVGWDRDKKITYWFNPPNGAIYWPLVSDSPVWISMDRLEAFPTLPTVVTSLKTQPIRKTPSLDGEETGYEFKEGDYERIVEYYPSGSAVWARLVNGGWIALLLHWEYLTDWSMVTLPPP
jgi:hypothetical protein